MVVIGLTGGIGTGKSSVAAMFSEWGAVVVDSDDLARDAVLPAGPAYAAVVERFGPEVVAADGRIDRAALAEVVFADAGARTDLEAIVHPAVHEALTGRLAAARAAGDRVVVAVVPLLVETGWSRGDAVVVVDCPEDVAVRRLIETRGMAEDDVRRRMAAQATRAERLAAADRVIVNNGSPADLRTAAQATWQWIQTLPSRSGPTLPNW